MFFCPIEEKTEHCEKARGIWALRVSNLERFRPAKRDASRLVVWFLKTGKDTGLKLQMD
jgi:hypothetical protein